MGATFGPDDDGVDEHQQTYPTYAVGSVPFVGFSFPGFFSFSCVCIVCSSYADVCVYRFICSFIYIYLQKFLQCIVDGLIGRRKSSQKGNGDGIDRLFWSRCVARGIPFRPGLCLVYFFECGWRRSCQCVSSGVGSREDKNGNRSDTHENGTNTYENEFEYLEYLFFYFFTIFIPM